MERLKQECHVYQDTVTFISVMYEFGVNNSILLEIEKDYLGLDGNPKTPDISLVEVGSVIDVIEHKGAMSENPQAAYDEVMGVASKYSQLECEGRVSSPRVALLYPSCSDSVVREIRPGLPENLTLCCFDQSSSDNEISFSIVGKSKSKLVDEIVTRAPIKYNPSTIRSTYKFIKASPPLIYTAYQIRSQFYIYRDIKSTGEDEYQVSRSKLLRDAQTFYPPWIRNNLQLNSSRVDAALEFLDEIDFVSWSGEDDICVYPSKGSRSGDQIDYFAKRLAAIRMKERKKREKREMKISKSQQRGQQSTLTRFQ